MSGGHGEKLSRKMDVLIAALLTEPTIAQAAQVARVGEATARRWMQRANFQQAYREARRAAVNQAIARLHQASSEAVNTLRSVMTDDSPLTSASAKVTAAKTVLELAIKAVELEDLQARVAALERAAVVAMSLTGLFVSEDRNLLPGF